MPMAKHGPPETPRMQSLLSPYPPLVCFGRAYSKSGESPGRCGAGTGWWMLYSLPRLHFWKETMEGRARMWCSPKASAGTRYTTPEGPPLPSRGHGPPAHRGTDLPGGSAPAPRAETSAGAGSPVLPGVTGAWRFFKTRSNFLFEAVDKSAQKLDNPSRFREIRLLRLRAPLQHTSPPTHIWGEIGRAHV